MKTDVWSHYWRLTLSSLLKVDFRGHPLHSFLTSELLHYYTLPKQPLTLIHLKLLHSYPSTLSTFLFDLHPSLLNHLALWLAKLLTLSFHLWLFAWLTPLLALHYTLAFGSYRPSPLLLHYTLAFSLTCLRFCPTPLVGLSHCPLPLLP